MDSEQTIVPALIHLLLQIQTLGLGNSQWVNRGWKIYISELDVLQACIKEEFTPVVPGLDSLLH